MRTDEARVLLHEERRHLEPMSDVLALQGDLAAIDAAFVRLAIGTYGRCRACGGAIDDARLRAVPSTRLCADEGSTPTRVGCP